MSLITTSLQTSQIKSKTCKFYHILSLFLFQLRHSTRCIYRRKRSLYVEGKDKNNVLFIFKQRRELKLIPTWLYCHTEWLYHHLKIHKQLLHSSCRVFFLCFTRFHHTNLFFLVNWFFVVKFQLNATGFRHILHFEATVMLSLLMACRFSNGVWCMKIHTKHSITTLCVLLRKIYTCPTFNNFLFYPSFACLLSNSFFLPFLLLLSVYINVHIKFVCECTFLLFIFWGKKNEKKKKEFCE